METIRWRVKPYFKWYDFWVGFYYDEHINVLYFGYFPTLGIKIYRG